MMKSICSEETMRINFDLPRTIATLVLSLCCVASSLASPYSGLYVFGDSLSDVGNDLLLTGGALPAPSIYASGATTGRFTNGLNYVDGLASALNLSITPSLAGGTDYAYGGARTTYITPALVPLGGLSFNQQIGAYDTTHAAADPNALYILWIGTNDMADAIRNAAVVAAGGGDPNPVISAAIVNTMLGLSGAISNLSGLGAEHFLIPNLPNLALIPAIGGLNNAGLSGLAQFASVNFNTNLANTLDLGVFSGLDIRDLNIYGALNAILANPGADGFTNVANACYTGEVDGTSLPVGSSIPPTICANPDQYVFWDYEHPTAAVHAQLAALAFATVVPEPPTWGLLLIPLGLIVYTRRPRVRL
jgi:phospholipase/lecithinase/hemolysin